VATLDEITRAVLARQEIARYIEGSHGEGGRAARKRVQAYLEEMRTTQRYPFYRALKHPLYPILRKIERVPEHLDAARTATREGRVVYASNHKSHVDYLVELLVLDENGVRPPIVAAGINLFGGPLGLLHKHVTGAIPIRRNTRDPGYLITLKAYVAERFGFDVAVVDLATGGVTHSATIGRGAVIYTTVISPDGRYLFVGTSGWVYRLNASTLGMIDSVAANTAINLAVHPTQTRLYVSNFGDGTVSEVDWTTMTVTRTIGSGSFSQAMAVSADGATLYVTYEGGGVVIPYDLGTAAPGTSISVPGATGLAIAGNTLYVTASSPGLVYAFDRTTGSPIYIKTVTGTPRRPAILPAGGVLIVPNEGGWVDFIQ